jgi:hypothetical protein
MSNLFVDTVQPFSSGSLTIISASLQGLSNISSSQVLYYNTSSGEVSFDNAPAGGSSISASFATSASFAQTASCANNAKTANYDIPDPGRYFYTNVLSTSSVCQTINTLDEFGLYYDSSTGRNVSPVDLQGNLIGTASFATSASYAPSTNIYNTDGTLDNNRTVSLGGNDLIFSASTGESFIIASDSASDVKITDLATATGSNVIYYDTTTGKLTYGATPSGGGGGGGGYGWSDGDGLSGYTGSLNLFGLTGSYNYTIQNTYAYATNISASIFSTNNATIGRAIRSAIIAGNNHQMQDNTGGFIDVDVIDSIIMGGTSNKIFGDAQGIYIIGGNNNSAEASGNRRSGIIGGGSNNAYAIEDSVIIGGSSNLLRSESDRSVVIGGANNTYDFQPDNVYIKADGCYQGTGRNNVVIIGARNFNDNMQDYNVYVGVNGGGGRTFTPGTSTVYQTYIDQLNVSGSLEASGSITIAAGQVLTMQPIDPLPASAPSASFAVSGSTPKPYFWDGANWNALY